MNANSRKYALEVIEKQAAFAKAAPKDKEQAAYLKGLKMMFELINTEAYTTAADA